MEALPFPGLETKTNLIFLLLTFNSTKLDRKKIVISFLKMFNYFLKYRIGESGVTFNSRFVQKIGGRYLKVLFLNLPERRHDTQSNDN
jgi:hypothetical protein